MFFSTSLTKNTSPPPNYLLYISAKGAVEHLVRILAKDLGSKGITVNAICPGPVDTDLFRNGKTEQQIQFFASMHPQKRIGTPDEVAPVVAFLAKDEAGWVNGQKLFVNGVSTLSMPPCAHLFILDLLRVLTSDARTRYATVYIDTFIVSIPRFGLFPR